ncbi:MAG: transposase [Nitrospirales bacterium]|nr:transposase [Nitrospirales bacterium]
MQRSDLKVAWAWLLKEQFRQFWDYTYSGAAQKFFARWFWRATHSRRTCDRRGQRLKCHLANVLTYFEPRHSQCGAGNRQQHHSMGQEDGARLPQRGELQDRHLFSL